MRIAEILRRIKRLIIDGGHQKELDFLKIKTDEDLIVLALEYFAANLDSILDIKIIDAEIKDEELSSLIENNQ